MKDINIRNKKATFDYEIIDKDVAGIELTGTEIKSIRNGKASINEAYCTIDNGEAWVFNLNISTYAQGSYNNHEPKRKRKLLLKKSDLKKWEGKLKTKGLTIIPLRLFINDRGWAKLQIALGKGKKVYDKRESIKSKDLNREMDRIKSGKF